MLAYIFPGQGAQHRGMGRSLFNDSVLFRRQESQINEIAGFNVRDACLRAPNEVLQRTELAQPCLFVVNALHLEQQITSGRKADMVAGHSLGEYSALLAADVIDVILGLRLVSRRAKLMSTATGGGMAAVLGLTPERVERALQMAGLASLEIANLNAPTQVVLSGDPAQLTAARRVMAQAGASQYIVLPVSAAFHSAAMDRISLSYSNFLRDVRFSQPRLPVISNVTARPYPADVSVIADSLVKHLRQPVLWSDTIQHMRQSGVSEFVEVGPSKILTRMLDVAVDYPQAAQPSPPIPPLRERNLSGAPSQRLS
jgi:malonyl CoA-acyl carrier protein transacylase